MRRPPRGVRGAVFWVLFSGTFLLIMVGAYGPVVPLAVFMVAAVLALSGVGGYLVTHPGPTVRRLASTPKPVATTIEPRDEWDPFCTCPGCTLAGSHDVEVVDMQRGFRQARRRCVFCGFTWATPAERVAPEEKPKKDRPAPPQKRKKPGPAPPTPPERPITSSIPSKRRRVSVIGERCRFCGWQAIAAKTETWEVDSFQLGPTTLMAVRFTCPEGHTWWVDL